MTTQITPGPDATAEDLQTSREYYQLLESELPRVRAAAVAWRNGLAGLLATLIGFSLIRGRSDVGQLASPWHLVVGLVLLAALVVGGYGAFLLLRAANGRPVLTPTTELLTGLAGDHAEAQSAARALTRGTVMVVCCTLLLVTAVATTWYGPSRNNPQLLIRTPEITTCGKPLRLSHGTLTLKIDSGEVSVDLGKATTIQAVPGC